MNELWMSYTKIQISKIKERLLPIENCTNYNQEILLEDLSNIMEEKIEFSTGSNVKLKLIENELLSSEGEYEIKVDVQVELHANSKLGFLYGLNDLLEMIQTSSLKNCKYVPFKELRMINHWDNLDGTVERGYSGKSIFNKNGDLIISEKKLRQYARILNSMKMNYVVINNVNAEELATTLLTSRRNIVKKIKEIFDLYDIKIMISLNFASPLTLGELNRSDPLNKDVFELWEKSITDFCSDIPYFGGFLIKADSEVRPGPLTYGRTHADG
ncbi:MAG: hypothetical protein ACK5G7_04570, partial [Erysipelotrichaceae bacterium]